VRQYRCERPATEIERLTNAVLAPGGRHAVFRRIHDLWLRELGRGQETRLTRDGVERYGSWPCALPGDTVASMHEWLRGRLLLA
jgi:hypothetical protein